MSYPKGVTVAAFYAGAERFAEYRDMIVASRVALQRTNPDANFIVLTDSATAPFIDRIADVAVVVPNDMPLMLKIIEAQRKFCSGFTRDLLVLPDIDCLANRELTDAVPKDMGLAITHKGEKFNYRINNLAYIHDPDLADWFLSRAKSILESWPREQWDWWGDQDAWGAACGSLINGVGAWVFASGYGADLFMCQPEKGKRVWLLPCSRYNCTMPDDGNVRSAQESAFFVHFKGPRKQHIQRWMTDRYGADWSSKK